MKNKSEILEKKRERTLAFLLKNDVRKKLREIMEDNDNEEAIKRRVKEEWFMLFTLANMAKGLREKLIKGRENDKKRQKRANISWFLTNKVRKFNKFKGSNVKERTILDIRM